MLLTGGSYLDIYQMHGLSKNHAYDTFWTVCTAIGDKFPIQHPYGSFNACAEIAAGFDAVSKNKMTGCVGALDGMAVRIERPRNVPDAMKFWHRKHFYALNLQAIVDSERR